MDEIARRQAGIEARLDTLSQQLEDLRRLVDERTRAGTQAAPSNNSTEPTAGERPTTENPSTTTTKPLQPTGAGVILPDSQEDTTLRTPPTRPKRTSRFGRSASVPAVQKPERNTQAKTNSALTIDASGTFDSAMVSFRNKQYRQSIEHLSKLITHASSRKGEYYYWRGLASFMLNEYEAARTDAQEALKLLQKEQSSLQADAMYLLAEIESTRGEMERALQLLRTILERFPKTDAAILARRKLQLLTVAK
jgi:TolA-binding protein